MSDFSRLLLISTGFLITAITLKSSDSALARKSMDFAKIDEQVQKDIEKSFRKTLSRLGDFVMDLPAKIVIQRLKNVEGNTFNDPFLVGNSQQVTSSIYVSDAVSDWCKGVISKNTRKDFEHKNRRIEVVFDCNRDMVFPSLRTIVRCILILLATNALLAIALFIFRIYSRRAQIPQETPIEKQITIDDYILDDDDDAINDSLFLENAEKWDASKLESCYD
ncbi:hypothetical protein L3Y34_009538 [Caenorhabditis briggsae]|uniref:Uncharacterized protein n=2 Tax=Caenorhabditis briggsae TaxID=6238 RepID=A0AAE9A7H2_CAEBR|nr:hypothetical protein L3Y34_009538 [Caenorhabditis briggsae]